MLSGETTMSLLFCFSSQRASTRKRKIFLCEQIHSFKSTTHCEWLDVEGSQQEVTKIVLLIKGD